MSIGAAAIGAAGELVGAGLSYAGQKSANRANIASAREQMAFQERMRDTQYQATMKDMELAGLNPILAARLGGAGVPPGAMGMSQSETAAAGERVGRAAASALEAKRMTAEIEMLKSNAKIAEINANSQFTKNNLEQGLTYWNQLVAAGQARQANAAAKNLELESAGKAAESAFYQSAFGQAHKYLEKILPSLSNASSMIPKKGPVYNKNIHFHR